MGTDNRIFSVTGVYAIGADNRQGQLEAGVCGASFGHS